MQPASHIAVALGLLVVLSGCHHITWTEPEDWLLRPGDVPRSLTMQSALLYHLRPDEADRVVSVPWYARRNDQRPTVSSGQATGTIEHSVTYGLDRQAHGGGHVHDHVRSRTFSISQTTIYR